MDDFSDFSIVIPSKSGGQSLVQLLKYLMKELPEVSIKVLLSSTIDTELKKLTENSQLDIHEYKTEVDFFSKVKDGLNLVSSEIVAVLTDDDIFLANSLAHAASFLNENSDFSACHGYFGSFECHEKKIHNWIRTQKLTRDEQEQHNELNDSNILESRSAPKP